MYSDCPVSRTEFSIPGLCKGLPRTGKQVPTPFGVYSLTCRRGRRHLVQSVGSTQMAHIEPFRALRYDPARVALSQVATQPYDKITPEMQESYYASSPY